jgi:hypothetical protein
MASASGHARLDPSGGAAGPVMPPFPPSPPQPSPRPRSHCHSSSRRHRRRRSRLHPSPSRTPSRCASRGVAPARAGSERRGSTRRRRPGSAAGSTTAAPPAGSRCRTPQRCLQPRLSRPWASHRGTESGPRPRHRQRPCGATGSAAAPQGATARAGRDARSAEPDRPHPPDRHRHRPPPHTCRTHNRTHMHTRTQGARLKSRC